MTEKEETEISALVSELYVWAISDALCLGERDKIAQFSHDNAKRVADQLEQYGIRVDCWYLHLPNINDAPKIVGET